LLKADCGHGQPVTKAFRKRMQTIRAALDERDFYAQKSLHFEKLQGGEGLRSMRLNDQWRLILEVVGEAPDKTVWIISIEDYH
jgi:proteic killer suppression protein